MDIKQAIAIISELAEMNDQPVLEQLMEMQDTLDHYTREQRIAYQVFMHEGQKMFAPA